MLGLCEYVEDELDRNLELSGEDDLEIVRELEDC
jgi:hypothetical protein